MPAIVLDNFINETPSFVESDGKNNLHARIDAFPIGYPKSNIFASPYRDDSLSITYPLCGWNETVNRTAGGSISWGKFMNACTSYPLGIQQYMSIVVDEYGNVAGFWRDIFPSLYKATPQNSGSTQNTTINIVDFPSINKLVLTNYNYSDRFFYIDNDLSGSWTAVTFTAGSYVRDALLFNNNLFLGQENPAGGARISRYNSSFSLVGSLIINTGGRIIGLRNYNNQYIAIFIRETQTEYMILWNGDVNSSSSERYILPSGIIDAYSHNGVLYILTRETNGFSLWYFNGSGFSLIFNSNKYYITEPNTFVMHKFLGSLGGYLAIGCSKRILFYNPLTKEMFGAGRDSSMTFLGDTNNSYFINVVNDGTNTAITKTFYVHIGSTTNGVMYSLLIDGGNLGKKFHYQSNWIVLGKRIKITNCRMYYTPNETPDKYLNIRFGYIDEKTGGSVQSKDYNFLQNTLTGSYKQFNVNIECTKFYVQVWSDPNLTTTSKSVRRVIIEYEELE
jgi:hypothetical protein